MNTDKVIIIGAPRSGTNMLRDILVELPGVGTWPCDEINYIWRHGNVREITDEFNVEHSTVSIRRYIRNEFYKLAHKKNLNIVVEKTCANSLRVPFIDNVIPDAKYIFIYRNGLDVIGSALIRWKAKLDIPYLLRKARYVPMMDLPYYAVRYFGNRVHRLFSKEQRLAFWGPRFKGLDEALRTLSLEEVCALQWKRCVDLSEQAFLNMPADKVVRVSYESLVSDPAHELTRILLELGLVIDDDLIIKATRNVSDRSVGKGRQELKEGQHKKILPLIDDTQRRYGYG